MDNDDRKGKRFNLWDILQRLIKAAAWQLRLRGCQDPNECGHDLTYGWIFGGKPLQGGYFLVLDDETLAAFIPNANDEGKVMHRLVSLKARTWRRDCKRCRFNTCTILEDFEDSTDERPGGVVLVDPKDSTETVHSLILLEEILLRVKNKQTRGFIVDHYIHSRSIEDIAKDAGLKANSVRRRILREIEALQAIFIPPPLDDEA